MVKKVLLICYYWPPAGGPGVQRWLGFARHLPDLGFQLTVVVPKNAHYPVLDVSLCNDLPQHIEVLRVPIKEPSRLASSLSRKRTKQLQKGIIENKPSLLQNVLLWLRGNLFIPDARVGWKPAVLKAVQSYVAENEKFTLITTGPPHSVHLIGYALKQQKKSIKWIADFRDPWTTIGYHKALQLTPRAAAKHGSLEQQTLDACDALLVTSPQTATEFCSKTQTPVHVLTNGFDISQNTFKQQPTGGFTLAHIGTLLADRNPAVLWQVLAKMLTEIPDFKIHFELVLAGNVANAILESIHDYGLTEYVAYKGYVAHNEAVSLMYNSQVLVLIEIDSIDTQAIIAGKIFEYLASHRPVVAIGPRDAAIATLLAENEAGAYFLYQDSQALFEYLSERFKAYKSQNNVAVTGAKVAAYSRQALTKSLAAIIAKQWES